MHFASFIEKITDEKLFDNETISFLNQDVVKKLSEILNEVKFPKKFNKRHELEPVLSRSFDNETVDKISTLISSLFFYINFADDYSELKKMLDKSLSSITDNQKETLSFFFNSLKYLEFYYDDRRLERYKTRANNYYKNMSYSCNAIGRFKKDYDYKNMQIENYEPEIIDTAAMVSLRFNTGDGVNDNVFIFSVDEDELDEVISILFAAQKELKILKNKIKC